ncbi:carboxypeptidase M32 [Emergencia sp.]|uniref:carboxypeptidase M32 n=1 Tax=Emergencia sp. TaxID=1926557 RepID=UPI003AF03E1F
MTYASKLREFKELISKIEYIKYTMNSLVYWDKITYMPKDGIEYRSKVMSFMANEQYKLLTSNQFDDYLKFFDGHKENDVVTESMIKRIKRNSAYVNRIPEKEYQEYIELIAVAEQVWEEAKAKADFHLFEPYLESIVETFIRFAEYWGYADDPYDALLGYYEENLTVSEVDALTEEIKKFLIDFTKEIQESGEKRQHIKLPSVEGSRQQALWEIMLSDLGFQFHAGRVDIGAHPTILANSPSDVRIVNSYQEDDLKTGIFNVLHEGGRGIYQQSIDKDLLGTFLAEGASFALEEAIGRLYENVIGRNKGFWTFFHPKLTKLIPELATVSAQEIFEDVNFLQPSLIRLDADELTYTLHVIIRYELEKDLINRRIKVSELPALWKEKYEKYLGITPSNDREGILQDIHWAAGYIGYFPLYFVSNIAATQLTASIEREHGSFDQLLADGHFDTINDWLAEHIFQYGAVYSFDQLMEAAAKEPLNPKYYIDYLRKKYSEVYKLNLKEKANE